MVIVTFTVLAAGEMKNRINEKLSQLIEEQPDNKLLQNQQLLLPNAKISTIHSLCSALIKDNFQNINISVNSRIADETELNILKNDVISTVLEEKYENENKDFLDLVEFTCFKDDKPLCEIIDSIYNYIRSFPFPKDFLKNTIEAYESATSVTENVWYEGISSHIIAALNSQIKVIENSIEKMKCDQQVFESYYDAFDSDRQQIEIITNLLNKNKWDDAYISIKNISKAKLKSVKKYEDKDFLKSLQDERKQVYSTLESIKNNYFCSSDEFKNDINLLLPHLKTLFSIVNSVYDIIEEKKRTLEIMDYADLEHHTLNLLVNKTNNGYEKTQLGETLSNSIDEIMIDECQDINEVQNLIFKLLSKNEKNLFMVGDVKQSVYRFRKAEPKLFIEKMKNFPKYNKENHTNCDNAYITLERNFRSRKEVCEFVNYVFSQIMSNEIGEINYEKSEYLVPEATFPKNDFANPEVHIIDYDK
ncbi:MAG: UvrD-helicase domain-containing protein, partial [Oscillospiraceae bacterium]